MDEYESVLLVKPEVFMYKIPPRTTNRAYRATDWNLAVPDWSGRLRLVNKGNECILKLEDKISGQLFGKCPIDTYPGVAIESVSDSSRYFVIRLQDENGRSAFIGIGFADRSDSFDLNVALQDHFTWLKKSQEIEKEKDVPKPELDLSFKEGETIKINMKIARKDGSEGSKSRPKSATAGLPPPPSGIKLAPPPLNCNKVSPKTSPVHHAGPPSGVPSPDGQGSLPTSGLELPLDNLSLSQQNNAGNAATTPSASANWVQF